MYLLESMGVDTGIDLEALIAARAILREVLPGESLYGHVPDAGVHKGFRYADSARTSSTPATDHASCGAAPETA